MRGRLSIPLALVLATSGCALTPSQSIETATLAPSATSGAVRGTPVVGGRPARVYVMAGFKEADCAPLVPTMAVAKPPSKGQVSFKPNQSTTIQHSASGKCLGKTLSGTGIYYTANPGQTGVDTFTVSATTGTGAPATKTFQVRIVE